MYKVDYQGGGEKIKVGKKVREKEKGKGRRKGKRRREEGKGMGKKGKGNGKWREGLIFFFRKRGRESLDCLP